MRKRLSTMDGRAIDLSETMKTIQQMVGRKATLYVNMGTQRNGRITDLIVNVVNVRGRPALVLAGLELNGDPSDEINFLEVTSMDIAEDDDE